MLIEKGNFGLIGLNIDTYKPNLFFKNCHFNTMFPYGFRKVSFPTYRRERWTTPDHDFFDVDFIDAPESREIVILLHGLEGGSSSQYIRGMSSRLSKLGVNIAAINHRSCSGEQNKTLGFYHSGFTNDISLLIHKLSARFDKVFVAGYSLGGNMILKYLGTCTDIPSQLKGVFAMSVPCHLSSSAVMLNHWKNTPYSIMFLRTLIKKIESKAKVFSEELGSQNYKSIKSLREYDNKVTAPLHGFIDAEDYYEKSSSKQFLHDVKVPALLINSEDDTFLAPPCFPNEIAKDHEYFHFAKTKYGGHVGFGCFNPNAYWSDDLAIQWFKTNGLRSS
jgi:uncharacterized protein